jgi:hypothetical protein
MTKHETVEYVHGTGKHKKRAPAKPVLSVAGEQTPYVGRLAKPSPLFRVLCAKYLELFGTGISDYYAERLEWECSRGGPNETTLMFVDEPPYTANGFTYFFLEAIGKDTMGDWHMLTLDQIILCQ